MQDFIVVGESRALIAQALLALHVHGTARCFVVCGRYCGMLRLSRLCGRQVRVDFYGADDERFVAVVNRHMAAHPDAIVVPADCEGTRMINRVRARLRAPIMPAPDAPALARMDDKWRFHQFCIAHGMPVPPAQCYVDKHAIAFGDAQRQFGLPFVVKPVNQAVSTGVVIVQSQAQFQAMIADNDAYRYAPLIVQRFVAGTDVSINLLSLHGTVAAMSIQRPIGSTVHFFAHAELEAIGHAIAGASGYHGLMNIDARIEEGSGKVYLFESNPRVWRSMAASVWCGVNFVGKCVERVANDLSQQTVACGAEMPPAVAWPGMPPSTARHADTATPLCLTAGKADVYYHPALRPAQWLHVFFNRGRQGRMARLMMADPYILVSSVRPACRTV